MRDRTAVPTRTLVLAQRGTTEGKPTREMDILLVDKTAASGERRPAWEREMASRYSMRTDKLPEAIHARWANRERTGRVR